MPEVMQEAQETSTNEPAEGKPGRRYQRAVAFCVVALLFGIAAVVLYPNRSAVYEPEQVEVSVAPNVDLEILTVTVAHQNATTGTISVRAGAFDAGSTAVDISYGQLSGLCDGSTCASHSQQTLVLRHVPGSFISYQATAVVPFHGASLGWSENGLDLEALTPAIVIDNIGVTRPAPTFGTAVVFRVHDYAAYDWGPQFAVEHAPAGVVIDQTMSSFSGGFQSMPSSYSVTSPSAARGDNLDLFMAGAFVGVLGSAGLTAVDAFFGTSGRRRSTKKKAVSLPPLSDVQAKG